MRTLLGRTVLVLFLGAGVLGWLSFSHAEEANSTLVVDAEKDDRVLSVASQLVCDCGTCPHEPLDRCRCGTAQRHRREIGQLLSAGLAPAGVISAMIEKHGNGIVATPPKHGLGLVVWVTPLAVALLGLGFVGLVVRRWFFRAHPRGGEGNDDESGESATAEGGSAQDYMKKVEEELEKLD